VLTTKSDSMHSIRMEQAWSKSMAHHPVMRPTWSEFKFQHPWPGGHDASRVCVCVCACACACVCVCMCVQECACVLIHCLYGWCYSAVPLRLVLLSLKINKMPVS